MVIEDDKIDLLRGELRGKFINCSASRLDSGVKDNVTIWWIYLSDDFTLIEFIGSSVRADFRIPPPPFRKTEVCTQMYRG